MKSLSLALAVLVSACAVPKSRQATHEDKRTVVNAPSGSCEAEEGACGDVQGEEDAAALALIGAKDFDNAFSLSKRNTTASVTASYANFASGNRNNTFNDVVVTFRKAAEPAATRNALNLFGNGTVVKTGLATNEASAKVTFKPSVAGAGVFYVYFQFKTVGEDVNTTIFKITITN